MIAVTSFASFVRFTKSTIGVRDSMQMVIIRDQDDVQRVEERQ